MDPRLQDDAAGEDEVQQDPPLYRVELAPQACQSCRKQKRKCDKQLPSCSLCVRIGRPCDYSPDSSQTGLVPSPDDFAALRQQVAELQDLIRSNIPIGGNANVSFGGNVSGNGNGNGNGSSNGSSNGNNDASGISGISDDLGSARPGLFANDFNGLTPDRGSFLAAPDSRQQQNQQNIERNTSLWPGPQSFPALFFLDSNAFQYERYQIQLPHLTVPRGALAALGNSSELRSMIEQYFNSVHTYFPIISRIRLYQHLSNPLHEPGADIALLFLAMKLCISEIPDGSPPQTQLYQDVKSFYNYIEAQNGFTMQSMQAQLLICLYECGHGLYPTAYISIGHAARLGYAEGLHDRRAPQMFPRAATWTEQEERQRVWWAIVILDRFVHIGHRRKPFATSDPSIDHHLPADDSAWDRGQMLAAAPLALSASSTIQTTPFARTCQAGHLLGKILRHLDDTYIPKEYMFEEALQLHRTMRALADVLPPEGADDDPRTGSTVCTSLAMCYSGLLTLYDAYSCTDRALQNGPETQLVMQKESIDGLREICQRTVQFARRVRDFIDKGGLNRLSPLVVDCLYQAAANYAWYIRESSDPECGERLAELRELLVIVDRRWKVAGAYLFILADYWGNAEWKAPGVIEGREASFF